MSTASITASITHHPLSMMTAAAAALAVLAFGTVVVTHDDSRTPAHHATNVDNFRKHAGRLQAPPSGGRTMIGLP